jgi:hypothetical protein
MSIYLVVEAPFYPYNRIYPLWGFWWMKDNENNAKEQSGQFTIRPFTIYNLSPA